MSKRYYMAYGSNLNKAQMRYRCPDAKAFGTTELKNYRLVFKGSKTGSYLTIEKSLGQSVPIGLWEVSENDEKNLDRYEGYPTFYYKKSFVLKKKNGETMDAFAYIMHEERPYGIPSSYYVDVCSKGYKDFGFDREILIDAIYDSIAMLDESEEVC